MNDTIFGKQILNLKTVFFPPQLLSERFLILRRIQSEIIINEKGSSCNVTFTLVRF